ncbi:methyltransferase type 11 [Anaeromyxobacter dehalogenans 2CP-1]|uniref:Methyltransferase type 11 n=1 Tax=Anaeromyxobacter dehalogenans (strain ATCC BAA-258 / DSM 21875 / 2CP-1) TaxID=455488 RepID=B8J756_ANAD2|nr:class I SAM-dependent methyltransferase [Anaeromyxobacter dehalogenans]ACL65246.1 methyltransferase type 11 [Anaeromyxobacter dehalogenans 2CP-1]
MPSDPARLEALRQALLAEATRLAPASLEALARPAPVPADGLRAFAATLLPDREALRAWLEAALAAPRAGAGFAQDPAGDLAARLVTALLARNQFLPVDAREEGRLAGLVAGALRSGAGALATARTEGALAVALAAVAEAFRADLAGFVAGLGGGAAPALREVVSAEYGPELQLRVLGLDAGALLAPVLDLGCGTEARLVRWLAARGVDARGVDRAAAPAGRVQRGDWLTVPVAPASLGTIVSHLGFSLHFLHHHLRPGDEAVRYARRYMELLRALRPGGTFAYAPGLPFVEAHLPPDRWRVETTPVPAPPPAAPGAAALPWYACRVTRRA